MTHLPAKRKPRTCANSKTSPAGLASADRTVKALELRREGLTFEEIAHRLGWKDKSSAHKAVATALKEIIAPMTEEVRAMEVSKLDHLERKIAKQVNKGNLKAVTVALRIAERRARLLGLDAPVKIEAPPGGSASFVVMLPAQAPTIDAWQRQALDVTPEEVEEVVDEPEQP